MNDYIRVSNPGVWMVLSAIVLILVGAIAWGILGHIDTTIDAVAVAENDSVILYVKEEKMSDISVGQTVHIGGSECTVLEMASQPIVVNEDIGDYICYVGDLHSGEWVYVIRVSGNVEAGVHSAKIVVESISPISFVLN